MKPSKRTRTDLISLTIIMPLLFVMGIEFIFMIPVVLAYLFLLIFDGDDDETHNKKSTKHMSKKRAIALFFVIFVNIFIENMIAKPFKDDHRQICGTLTSHEQKPFPRSPLSSPNTILKIDNHHKTFHAKFVDIPSNSQVCITYIDSDKTMWFFRDYVLHIKAMKH